MNVIGLADAWSQTKICTEMWQLVQWVQSFSDHHTGCLELNPFPVTVFLRRSDNIYHKVIYSHLREDCCSHTYAFLLSALWLWCSTATCWLWNQNQLPHKPHVRLGLTVCNILFGHRTARLSSSSFLWFPLFISTTSDFKVCVSVQMQLMHTSSLKPSGISQNLSHPFSSYYKLFACNASGCHVDGPGRGLGCRCSCLGLVAQSTPHFVFLVSWRARLLVGLVSRWLVCLFISNSQWPAYVCINTEGQLPVITDHTHVCIYKPIIYSMYCNCVSACRRRRVLYVHCGRFPRKNL